jgi:hypothetical protein
MELHQKDYLPFEEDLDSGSANTSSTTSVTESILEVDFEKQLDSVTWQGFWKPARPIIAGFVRAS